jgi:hypothetical protein
MPFGYQATDLGRIVFGPFDRDWAATPSGTPPIPMGAQRPNFDWTRPNPGLVQYATPGDWIEFNNNGRLYQIADVRPPSGSGASALPSFLVLAEPLRETVRPPFALTADTTLNPGTGSNYRIIRRARPIPGERPADLPDRTVIDLSAPNQTPPLNPANNKSGIDLWFRGVSNAVMTDSFPYPFAPHVDIMFAPTGEVINATAEVIYLWVRENPATPLATMTWYGASTPGGPRDPNLDAATNPDNQALIVIYTRTGAIMTYPVDQMSPNNPYTHAQTGRGSGGP